MKKSVMTGWAWAVLFTMVCCSTPFALGFPETVSGAMKTLAVIANVWAKGGPYDFLKSAEFHNHI